MASRSGAPRKDALITDNFNTKKINRGGRPRGTTKAAIAALFHSNNQDDNDIKSAYQMLQDMRWVYRDVKGRKKLRAMVAGDDRQFVFLVKELMKIEAAVLAAKIRKTDEPISGSQNFFVVLKGLEGDKSMLESIDINKEGIVGIRQMQNILKPDGKEYEMDEEERKNKSSQVGD